MQTRRIVFVFNTNRLVLGPLREFLKQFFFGFAFAYSTLFFGILQEA